MNLYQSNDTYEVLAFASREEWKKARTGFIGGSDASALIGMNPWKDNNTIWKEKKGIIIPEDISNKPFVKYGIEAEPLLRGLFALDYPQYDVQYMEDVTLKNKAEPWMLYSPDGLLFEPCTGHRGILEIKTTNILQSMQREKWNEKIPNNYYIQVLHGLLVTGFDFVVLKAQLRTEWKDGNVKLETKHYTILREEVQDDLNWLLKTEKEQWMKYYVGDIEPPTMLPLI